VSPAEQLEGEAGSVTVAEVAELVRAHAHERGAVDGEIDGETRLDWLASLEVVEVVVALEERHGFRFDHARAAEVKTVRGLAALANESLGARAPA
jgi:acyl carrier protein